jgi:hypothetical protein
MVYLIMVLLKLIMFIIVEQLDVLVQMMLIVNIEIDDLIQLSN